MGVATLAFLTSVAFFITAGATPALAQVEDAYFAVQMVEQEIHASSWEQGVDVTATIDDPSTPENPDWSDTQTALPPSWDPTIGFANFQPFIDGFVIEPGFVVTLSQEVLGTTYTKTHTVSYLQVTNVDEDNDIVSGVGEDGAVLAVDIWGEGGTWREVTVVGDTWSADFGVEWQGGDTFDITQGTQGQVAQHDDDGDTTQWSWSVPDPAFSVETPHSVWSTNDGWVPGRTVTLTVDDNDDLLDGYLYETSTEVVSWGPYSWDAGWGIDLPFSIEPGHYVTVDDGVEVTKVLQVVDLAITSVDAAGDTISGTSPPFAEIDVHACDAFECENVLASADGGGAWTATFSLDIQVDFGGAAQIFDSDGDSTHRGWQLQEPHLAVDVANEEMWAVNWPAGETLTFQVFADQTMADLLWSDTMTVYGTPWQNTEAGYRFWGDFDIQGGQYFTVTDGVTSKALAVSSVSITDVDPFDDSYAGTVDPAIPADVGTEVCAWARTTDPNDGVELCAVPDDTTGDWTIDFTGVGDIIPGDHLGVYQRDPDGDMTHHSWGVPPWIYVELAEQDELGNDLYPDRVYLDQWIGPVDISLDGVGVMSGVVTNGGSTQVDLDVEIGQTIRVVDGQNDKSLLIELLTVDDVTAWDDPVQPSTVHGTADVGVDDQRQIQVTASAEYGWWTERWVPVVADHYQADFANPGNGWRESEIGYFGEGGADDVYLGGEVRANLWDFDNDQVQAIWHTCNPRIIIVRNNDRIEAVCFPVGSQLVVELDDPATPGIDWTSGDPVTVTRNPEKPWETLVVFPLGDYTAPDAAVVTATASADGDPIVEVTTEIIAFTIDQIDVDNDVVAGTAPADSQVLVEADGQWRHPTAGADGSWLADFSVPGEGQAQLQTVDIGPGSEGGATLIDENGSATTVAWRVSNATFNVDPRSETLWINEFEPESALTITVDDGSGAETVPGGPYATDGDGYLQVDFDPASLDLQPGDVVTVSDGGTTKTHTITNLEVTEVDEAADTVSGSADPLSDVDVWVHDNDAWRHVEADPDGNWTADFGLPGDEPGEGSTVDLVPGSNGNSGQCDADGDCTNSLWNLANPQINVDPHGDRVWGSGWTPGESVAIDIDGVPYTTWVATWDGSIGDWETPVSVDIIPNMIVEAFGSQTTKTHTVTALAITEVDPAADTISGVATPLAWVGVWFHDGREGMQVLAHTDGSWTADFSGSQDVRLGDSGAAAECDGDGDCTYADWNIVNPVFSVDPHGDWVWGNEWQPNGSVTVTVGAFSTTLSTDEWGNFGDGWDQEAIDLQPDDEVTVSDGVTTKTHTITSLAVTEVSEADDTVSGSADPLSAVDVWVHDNDAWRHVVADDDGLWTADFGVPGDEEGEDSIADLAAGSNGNSGQCDDDGDCTNAGWWVANPTFSVETPNAVWSSSEDWELGDTITLTIDDPNFPGPVTTTVTDDDGYVGWWIDLQGIFEIQPGHVVTVTDGEHTKVLTVADITIETIDPDTGVVSGMVADEFGDPLPDVTVDVNIDNEFGHAHRSVTTGADGSWHADFSVAGDGEGPEAGPLDIVPGTGISAQVFDEDWDSTHRGDCHECGGGGETIDPIGLEPGDVLVSETDGTLWVYDPDDGSLEEHPLPFGGVWDIQFVWRDILFIANSGDGRIWALDLPSGQLEPIEDPLFGFPIGMSIQSASAVGWSPETLWIADGASGVLRFDDGGAVQVVDMQGVDGIVVAPDGAVYFSNSSGALLAVDESESDNYRVVADVGGHSLNGLVMLPDGRVLATSMSPPALIAIDPSTGEFEIEEHPELWSPEDSALGRAGEIYVIDSGLESDFGDHSGLYVQNGNGTLTQLVSHHDVAEFGDTVDVLVVGPTVAVTKTASQAEVFAPDGGLVAYTLDVVNQLGPFGQVSIDTMFDSMSGDLLGPDACPPIEGLASGEGYTCTYETLVAADIINEVVVGWTDELGATGETAASAHVAMVEASVSIDKTVASATAGPGDGILAAPGEMLTWSYVVTNDGAANVRDLTVVDDVFGEVCSIGDLAVGESTTCTVEAAAEQGEHANVAIVTGTAVDADGDEMAVEAQDASSYVGLDPVYVTDSSLCVIDGFDLVFTPDLKNWPGHYKLAASNPGQFYWNGFVGLDDPATIAIEVPYPFVTQGAMPLHDHGGVDVGDGGCFEPLDEGIGHAATFGLGDYADTNGDGVVGFGDVYAVEIDVSAGFHYLTLHLDYGLEKTNGWTSDGSNAFNDPEIDPEFEGIDVMDATDQEFAVWVDGVRGASTVIANHNEFKQLKGFGGLVVLEADGTPVAGAELELRSANGTPIETMTTDANGWYLSDHRHNGKETEYIIALLDPAGGDRAAVTVTVGKKVKFGEANFAF